MKAFPEIILRLRNNLLRVLQLFISMVLRYEFCRLRAYILNSERQYLIIYVGDAFRESMGYRCTYKQCARRSTKHTIYGQRLLKIKGVGQNGGAHCASVDHNNAERFLDVRSSG